MQLTYHCIREKRFSTTVLCQFSPWINPFYWGIKSCLSRQNIDYCTLAWKVATTLAFDSESDLFVKDLSIKMWTLQLASFHHFINDATNKETCFYRQIRTIKTALRRLQILLKNCFFFGKFNISSQLVVNLVQFLNFMNFMKSHEVLRNELGHEKNVIRS